MGDGKLLAVGGTNGYPRRGGEHYDHYTGIRNSVLFEAPPQPRPWKTLELMHTEPIIIRGRREHSRDGTTGGRWYPTLVTLADGNVLRRDRPPAGCVRQQ